MNDLNGLTYFFRTFKVAHGVTDLEVSFEMTISGVDSPITINFERLMNYQEFMDTIYYEVSEVKEITLNQLS